MALAEGAVGGLAHGREGRHEDSLSSGSPPATWARKSVGARRASSSSACHLAFQGIDLDDRRSILLDCASFELPKILVASEPRPSMGVILGCRRRLLTEAGTRAPWLQCPIRKWSTPPPVRWPRHRALQARRGRPAQWWPKVTDAAHCSVTMQSEGLHAQGWDGAGREKFQRARAVGEGCRGGILPDLSGNQRGVQAESMAWQLTTVGSMKSSNALIAFALRALLGPGAAAGRRRAAEPPAAGADRSPAAARARWSARRPRFAKVNGNGITVRETIAADDSHSFRCAGQSALSVPGRISDRAASPGPGGGQRGYGRERRIQAAARLLPGQGAAGCLFYGKAQAGGDRYGGQGRL